MPANNKQANKEQKPKFKKVVTSYKGFKIQQIDTNMFLLFTKDEWSYGEGYRSAEWEAGTIEEAKQFIDCY
jgi:hypothetical protein